ncbi:metal-sensitive transcriptional regulator [Dermabacter vaginalis]|uniref:Metal-sensitive transcriptional regulator n=1 Tax=Dermabacter vaginalis TaxID=1630135 RepID=A0ABX6A251_9MICO|nr:metal-sensitive transcriptional regulator [Dermabacter vaginalis]QEU11237.1 metal-sensitive transcriptional regulator [Dermabacter vaginalis]
MNDCHGTSVNDHAPGYHADKEAYVRRLRRIEGQVRGLQRMLEDDTYCIDVLTQVSAVKRALEAVSLGLVEDHVRHCVRDAATDGSPAVIDEKLTEVLTAVKRLM